MTKLEEMQGQIIESIKAMVDLAANNIADSDKDAAAFQARVLGEKIFAGRTSFDSYTPQDFLDTATPAACVLKLAARDYDLVFLEREGPTCPYGLVASMAYDALQAMLEQRWRIANE